MRTEKKNWDFGLDSVLKTKTLKVYALNGMDFEFFESLMYELTLI